MRLIFPISFLIVLVVVGKVHAQDQQPYPLSNATYSEFEGLLHQAGEQFHTAVRPYRIKELNESIPFDSLRLVRYYKGKFWRTLVGRKIAIESLINVDSSKFQVYFDPVFHMDLGWDVAGHERHALNTRGFTAKGSIGRKVSFYTAFWETQATYMPYLTAWIDSNQVIPGQGRIKDFVFDNFFYSALGIKQKGYDFLSASGLVSFTPTPNFNVQIGNDKHFIGEGYRSLLLSDAAFSYPFLKLTTKYRGFQYVHLLTQLQDNQIPVLFESGFKKKWATFHYLSVNIGKRVQFGLFEGIIFKGTDANGNTRFDWNYINPLMMIRPIQFAIQESENNVLVGLNLKVVPFSGAAFYGQFVFDDLNFSKLGKAGYLEQKLAWQIGFKAFDLMNVKNLSLQLEYNAVRPYTYADAVPIQSYMHMSQPLGHPLGANFHEFMGMIGYRYKDLRLEFRTTYAIVGRDSIGLSYGNDTYRSDVDAVNGQTSSGNSIGQGLKTILTYQNLEASYVINRASNFTIRLGVMHRYSSNSLASERNLMFYFGIRSDLRNLYHDF